MDEGSDDNDNKNDNSFCKIIAGIFMTLCSRYVVAEVYLCDYV